MASRRRTVGENRGKEVAGVVLLAFGIFFVVFGLHPKRWTGHDGPWRGCNGNGLYGLAGYAAYGLKERDAAVMIMAFRCFRRRAMIRSFGEPLAALGFWCRQRCFYICLSRRGAVTFRGQGSLLVSGLGRLRRASSAMSGRPFGIHRFHVQLSPYKRHTSFRGDLGGRGHGSGDPARGDRGDRRAWASVTGLGRSMFPQKGDPDNGGGLDAAMAALGG